MDEKYSIQEILTAIDDLNNLKKNSSNVIKKEIKKLKMDDGDIPSSTLKLIEEAESVKIKPAI